MNDEPLIAFCTCPDRDSAHAIAQALVEAGSAACVNILPGLCSVYLWQGKLERSEEYLLMAKTTGKRYRALEEQIQSLHPYELPEIVAVPITTGLPEYLAWVRDATTTHTTPNAAPATP